jgi:hypothetical protein
MKQLFLNILEAILEAISAIKKHRSGPGIKGR